MARDPERSRRSILDAAERLLRRGGPDTIDQVAHEAHCAKGLVHYHFRTKGELLAAVATRFSARRRQAWIEAFRADTPAAAIQRSWDLLLSEHRGGALRAWGVLCAEPDRATGRAVNNEIDAFGLTLTEAASALLAGLGLESTVPAPEIGLYLAAVIHGMGVQLAAGARPARLQGAYAAAWLGALSLTRPVPH